MLETLAVGALSGAALWLSLRVGGQIVGRLNKGKPSTLLSLAVGSVIIVPGVLIPLAMAKEHFDGRKRAASSQHEAAAKGIFMKEYCAQRRAQNDAPSDCFKW